MPVITRIEDLRVLAQKPVPRMFYDDDDSGSWTEGNWRTKRADFQAIKLRQRVAEDMSHRSTATTMLGQPMAIAPTRPTGMPGEGCRKPGELSAWTAQQSDPKLSWADVEWIKKRWGGTQHPYWPRHA